MIQKILQKFGYMLVKASATAEAAWNTLTFGSFANAAKEKVNNSSALTVSTVYAAIRNISEDIAKLPLKVYKKDGKYRYEQSAHPAALALQYNPHEDMTAMGLKECLTAQALGWGNAYAEIRRDVEGKFIGLSPLRPDSVRLYRNDDGKLIYEVRSKDNSAYYYLWQHEVFHLHGLGGDGISGYNVIMYMAQSIGSAIAMDKFSGAFFGNGLNAGGHLEHPQNLSTEAQQRLKKQMQDQLQGADNAFNLMVLEEGMKFAKNVIDPKASQMIETRQFTVSEFCRWLRIPPHKVADLSRATFSNIEQQNIDYVTDSLMGWMERWEQELWRKVLTPQEQREGYYFEIVVDGLLRGDVKTRYEAYSQLWDRGVLSINEIRAKENMNPITGGDTYFVPLNFSPLGSQQQVNGVVEDAVKRIVRHRNEAIKSAKDKHGDDFNMATFMEHFNQKHEKYTQSVLNPLDEHTSNLVTLLLESHHV